MLPSRALSTTLLAVTLACGVAGPASAVVTAGAGGRARAAVVARSSSGGVAEVRYVRPVDGGVVRGYDAADRYGPGHRGLDLYAPAETPVVPAADGVVTFVGTIAGTTWVTVAHADGIRTTYGHLADVAVTRGQYVGPATVLGASRGDLSNGRPHVHWGARDDHGYLDPNDLLRRIVRVRLDAPTVAGIVVPR